MNNPIAIGRYIQAKTYYVSVLSRYGENPLIEAIPPMLSSDEFFERVKFYPICFKEDVERSIEERLELIFNINQYFQPIDLHYDTYQKAYNAIKSGYLTRNPAYEDYWDKIDEKEAQAIDFAVPPDIYFSLEGKSIGFPVIGMSGIGKSLSLRKVLKMIPQVIYHSRYNEKNFSFTQLSWVIVECPRDGSTKSLCENFFEVVDKILKTNYYSMYVKPSIKTNKLMHYMKVVCWLHGIGLIVIDEIQVLSIQKSQGEQEMLNFFVELDNSINVPIVLVGTDKARKLFSTDFRTARRADGQGDTPWQRMLEGSDTWNNIAGKLLEINYLEIQPSAEEKENIKKALYRHCQGITDILVKLYILAQERALLTGQKKLTPSVIGSVSRDSLTFVKGFIEAIKKGNLNELMLMTDDIYDIDLEKRFEEEKRAKLDGIRNALHPKSANPEPITTPSNTLPKDNTSEIETLDYKESGANDLRKLFKEAIKQNQHPYDVYKSFGIAYKSQDLSISKVEDKE